MFILNSKIKNFIQYFFSLLSLLILVLTFSHCRSLNKQTSDLSSTTSYRQISSFKKCNPSDLSLNHHNALVLMYHRFDGKYSSTSVTREMLKQHIGFFRSKGFDIVPLSRIVNAHIYGTGFPKKTLAITIDDAYKSAYEVAHPLFVQNKIPYTVFVNTEGIDRKLRDYMTWNQLREIKRSGWASLEAHGHAHAYMIRNMNSSQRKKDVKTSVLRLYKETGRLSQYFAYPYGETNDAFIQELKNYRWNIGGKNFHFKAAFTTQSGPVGCASNRFALPRFALNMRYGKVSDLFRAKMNSRHFPFQSFFPKNLAFCTSAGQKKFSLTVQPDIVSHLNSSRDLSRLNCFASNGEITIKKQNSYQADIILNRPFTNSSGEAVRERINCTLSDGKGRVFWLGKEFSILDC